MLQKIGPLMNLKTRLPVPMSSSRISVPVMSLGMRSGVNWMREYSRLTIFDSVEMRSVLANPGTPTSRQLPPENRAMSSSDTTSCCPTMTLASSVCRAW